MGLLKRQVVRSDKDGGQFKTVEWVPWRLVVGFLLAVGLYLGARFAGEGNPDLYKACIAAFTHYLPAFGGLIVGEAVSGKGTS